MARLLPHAVVVCLAGATFAAAGLVFGEGIDARVRAGVLGGATAVIVLAAVMVFRRVDAGVEARRRASIRAERVYPLAGPSPLRATLPLRGRGACTVNCWLRGRASGTYE